MRDFDVKFDIITANNIKTYFEIKLVTFINKLTIKFFINYIEFHVM